MSGAGVEDCAGFCGVRLFAPVPRSVRGGSFWERSGTIEGGGDVADGIVGILGEYFCSSIWFLLFHVNNVDLHYLTSITMYMYYHMPISSNHAEIE